MAEKYRHRDDLHRRLNRTICLWEGEPYLVITDEGLSNGDFVTLYKPGRSNKSPILANHTDPKFMDRSLPLGYMNLEATLNCHYLYRMPQRRTVQPISLQNVGSIPRINGYDYINTREIVDCIKGNYPSFSEALNNINQGWRSYAFHRYVAVGYQEGSNRLGLYYRGRLLGFRNLDEWHWLPGQEVVRMRKIVENLGVIG